MTSPEPSQDEAAGLPGRPWLTGFHRIHLRPGQTGATETLLAVADELDRRRAHPVDDPDPRYAERWDDTIAIYLDDLAGLNDTGRRAADRIIAGGLRHGIVCMRRGPAGVPPAYGPRP